MLRAALDSNAALWDRPRHGLLEAVQGLLPLWLRRRFASFEAAKSAEFA